MSGNLKEEAKWWASDGKKGTKPHGIVSVTKDVTPFYSTYTDRNLLKSSTRKRTTPKKVTSKKWIPVHKRKNKSELNTETLPKKGTRRNRGPQYRISEHQREAIKLLNKNGFNVINNGKGIIKFKKSDFFDIDCKDIHIHVYNNHNTGQNGAGIRFRFEDGTELQYNIADGGGRDGFYLVNYKYGKKYKKVSNGLSLPKTLDVLLTTLETDFKNSKCQIQILKLGENLSQFIQNIINAVEIAAGAYQNPMAGLRGGKRKTRKKRKTRRKRKTRKRKKIKKRKTRRKKR